jgi:hypothetical protein
VALQAQKDNPNLASRTYGSPVWDPFGTDNTERGYAIFDKAQGKLGGVERYRSFGDPVSVFDGSAHSSLPGKEALRMSGPHACQGLAAQHMSEGLAAQANPDGTISQNKGNRTQETNNNTTIVVIFLLLVFPSCTPAPMLQSPPAPTSAKLPPTNEWPAAWKSQADKALGPGATELQHEDARRMGSALSAMLKKDIPDLR